MARIRECRLQNVVGWHMPCLTLPESICKRRGHTGPGDGSHVLTEPSITSDVPDVKPLGTQPDEGHPESVRLRQCHRRLDKRSSQQIPETLQKVVAILAQGLQHRARWSAASCALRTRGSDAGDLGPPWSRAQALRRVPPSAP